jgi:hypothetical protein
VCMCLLFGVKGGGGGGGCVMYAFMTVPFIDVSNSEKQKQQLLNTIHKKFP